MDLAVLNPAGQTLLLQIGIAPVLRDAYLAGGTALSLQLSHRRSYDLDLFIKTLPPVSVWQNDLRQFGTFRLLGAREQGFLGTLNGVQISLNPFPYPLLENLLLCQSLKVAGLKDLSAMKLFAIISRTRLKDIVDLYFLAQKFSLTEMLIFFEHKFEGLEVSEPVILKALTDWRETPEEPIDLIKQVSLDKVKSFWIKQVKRYLAKD